MNQSSLQKKKNQQKYFVVIYPLFQTNYVKSYRQYAGRPVKKLNELWEMVYLGGDYDEHQCSLIKHKEQKQEEMLSLEFSKVHRSA